MHIMCITIMRLLPKQISQLADGLIGSLAFEIMPQNKNPVVGWLCLH